MNSYKRSVCSSESKLNLQIAEIQIEEKVNREADITCIVQQSRIKRNIPSIVQWIVTNAEKRASKSLKH